MPNFSSSRKNLIESLLLSWGGSYIAATLALEKNIGK